MNCDPISGLLNVVLVFKRFETLGLKTSFNSGMWTPRALSVVRGAALVVLLYLSKRQVVRLTFI
jgi:hypothetical protein